MLRPWSSRVGARGCIEAVQRDGAMAQRCRHREGQAELGIDRGGRSLLARGGLYARLWTHQSGGFLIDETEDDDDLTVEEVA